MNIQIIGKEIQVDSVEMFAIENDNLTESTNFIIDRYQGDTDLNELFPFVVYRNVNGIHFEILEKTLSQDDTKIIAKWITTRAVTEVDGRFDFCITFVGSKNYTDINNGSSVWSTKISSLNVAKSLIGEDYSFTEEPVLIELMRLVTEVYDPIEKAKNAAIDARIESETTLNLLKEMDKLIDTINGENPTNISDSEVV